MKLEAIIPMLRTNDLKSAVEFYEQMLGFACDEISEELGWASLSRDDVHIMLALPNAHEPFERAAFTGSLYIRCDDVDALWEQLRNKARVCYPIEDFGYGMREFAIYDNDGYLLQFGSEIDR